MASLPMLTAREVIRALERAGFQVQRQTGSHARLKHADGRVVTVPVHAGQDVGRGYGAKSSEMLSFRVRSSAPFSRCTKNALSIRFRSPDPRFGERRLTWRAEMRT